MRCNARTLIGTQCKYSAQFKSNFCGIHKKRRFLDDKLCDIPLKGVSAPNEIITKSIVNIFVDKIISNMLISVRCFKCLCCFDNFPNSQLITCSCDSTHKVCVECLTGFIESNIEIGATLNCMFNCAGGGVYTKDNIRMAVNSWDTFSKFSDAIIVQEIAGFAKIIENYHICPLCSKYGCIIDPEIRGGVFVIVQEPITCEYCSKIWCSTCRKEYHVGHCYTIKFDQSIAISKTCQQIDNMIQEISTSALTHTCPSCKIKFFKEDGCNNIKCPKCSTNSCYVCGMKIEFIDYRGGTYYHFKGHAFARPNATCPLWNNHDNLLLNVQISNVLFNNKKIKTEIELFIQNNTPPTQLLIYERLKKMNPQNDDFLKFLRKKYKLTNTSDNICTIL